MESLLKEKAEEKAEEKVEEEKPVMSKEKYKHFNLQVEGNLEVLNHNCFTSLMSSN